MTGTPAGIHRGSPSACPSCGRENDSASEMLAPGATPPAEGNWSLCWGCGGLAVFTGHGVDVRPPTDAELVEAQADVGLQLYRNARLRILREDGQL